MVVGDLMTRELVTLRSDETLSIADRIMSLGRIRHMPVVDDDGRVVGMISQRDLFRGALARALGFDGDARQQALDHITVAEVMRTELHVARADTPIGEAADTMIKYKIGCLPVVDATGKLTGLITEADFVAHVGRTAT
jgi:CBS domain-containing membrane protein